MNMRKSLLLAAVAAGALVSACAATGEGFTGAAGRAEASVEANNPFFRDDYGTPFGMPPFDEIEFAHYRPAFEAGVEELRAETIAIAENPEPATFENTIVAMEQSGALLSRVANVFYNLTSADTTDELQALQAELSPELARVRDEISLNADLFERIQTVYEERENLGLDGEQMRLVERYYLDFVRSGALLSDAEKEQLTAYNARLAELTTQFGQNHLANTNGFNLVVEDEADLAGLPEPLIDAAATAAARIDREGAWAFGLNRSSFEGFMTYAEDRDLREELWRGYVSRGDAASEHSNEAILIEIAQIRAARAELLGYESHAHYVLEDRMAGSPDAATGLMQQLWRGAVALAERERADMQAIIDADGDDFDLAAWDWWYYAERLRQQRYDFDPDLVRPYFEINAVRDACFSLADRLWGLQFTPRDDIPVYNDVVQAFEVSDADGTHLGVYLFDPYARPSKRDGAWMNTYRDAENIDENIRPLVVNVFNYTQPPEGEPLLLSFDEANTVFHEFGHALHGLMTTAHYPRFSGTATTRDFVEFPSQMLENWAFEPEVMEEYARHVETGEPIPPELVERVRAAQNHNQGFQQTELVGAALLDLAWHSLSAEDAGAITDARAFETAYMSAIGIPDIIEPRYRSPYFAHIFSGGYSAGYYGYLWANVLEADAYAVFADSGDPFNPVFAQRIRDTVFALGGSVDPMELYVMFRGREPEVDALLARLGFDQQG